MTQPKDAPQPRQTPDPITIQIRRVLLALLVVVMLIVVGVFLDARVNGRGPLAQMLRLSPSVSPPAEVTDTQVISPTPSDEPPTLTPTTSAVENPDTATPSPSPSQQPETSKLLAGAEFSVDEGVIFLAMNEGGRHHLFAYHPQNLPFTRLTSGNWDDIHPAISPDGTRLAFASNRDGVWDLYMLEVFTGKTSRLTNSPEYDGAPSWSSDGQYLVYESYTTTLTTLPPKEGQEQLTATPPVTLTIPNMEIFIRPVGSDVADQAVLRLTDDPAADFTPAWSPSGRHIAFVSNRSGENEIWLADLDRIEDRFRNLSQNPKANDAHPVWDSAGRRLAWSAQMEGFQNILLIDVSQSGTAASAIGAGDWPAWSPSNDILVTPLSSPNRAYLTAYQSNGTGLVLPALPLLGSLSGLCWGSKALPQPLPSVLNQAARSLPTPPYQDILTPITEIPSGRMRVVSLDDVQAPYPLLHDRADESFIALRNELSRRLGWDFLSVLQNAYVPLTSPLFPGLLNDWLYTGRAIELNTAPVNAGWMVFTREDFGPSTYWRVFLRTRFQDGTQGIPLEQAPWDLNARYQGDPRFYEQGGAPVLGIPSGYWLDFTELASSYGWERLPALSTWRSALPAARLNEFVLTGGLDWFSAMVEVYPVDAVYTPTPIQPPTFTPTITRRPTLTPTPTRTPFPTRTPTVTRTATITRTPTLTLPLLTATP